MITVLFVGDIVSEPGVRIFEKFLPQFQRKHDVDLVIVNGENIHEGKSITPGDVNTLIEMGVDVITSGNHIWDRFQVREVMKKKPMVLRPLNYPEGVPGKGTLRIVTKSQKEVIVMNLQGRTFMPTIDCPFRAIERELKTVSSTNCPIIVDFHAEATAEKQAMAWFLDGEVSALVCTHTHIQTADERVFPRGTAFISDVGMTGAHDSVIGMQKEIAIKRFLYHTPFRYESATDDLHVSAVLVCIDEDTLKAKSIERIFWPDWQ
jgi:2',3'-cyclic-nucleotide 2'-phosphodiesterase